MVEPTEPPNRLETSHRISEHTEALTELLVGCVLLGAATLAGLVFLRRPGPNRLDAIGFGVLPADPTARWAVDVAKLGSFTVLLAGVAVLCVVAAIARNWTRALSCLIAPIAAVLIVQIVAKPLVGRHMEGVLSYPSGTVTVTAALAAAAFLVVPRLARPFAAAAGGGIIAAICVAVVVLRWHFPTDALGGVCVGVGAVLALDGLLLWARDRPSVRKALAVLRGQSVADGEGTPQESADSSEAMNERPLQDVSH
jgi:membrane-associated phospholipid phosphatase